MTEINYRDAVKRLKSVFESMRCVEGGESQGQDLMHPSGAAYSFKLLSGIRGLGGDINKLIKLAANSHYYYEALKFGIAFELERNNPLPDEARIWLSEYLGNKFEPPKPPVGKANSHVVHMYIATQIYMLVQDGMKATRNDASPPLSACDAVAEALDSFGLKPSSFHGVKKIWLETKNRFSQGISAT